ncbi:MAG: hypothetical protein QOE64_1417 [Frankiales bacterium]|nr:hypothetical protein [Frankiales bacterium]
MGETTVTTPRPTDPQARATHERNPEGYRPALDGVRAIAVSSVVAYHFGFNSLRGGFLGVDVFFVLSGYLITSILLTEYATRDRISLSGFYLRRLRRLFPALGLVVLVVSVATVLYSSSLQLHDRFRDMIAALFYYANWHFIASDQSYFAGLSGASPLRHTWSLAIEEQFYFVWPVLLLIALRLGALRRRWVLLVLLAAATAASVWAMAHTFDPAAPSRAYYGSDGRAQQLLVGVLLAVALFGLQKARGAGLTWTAVSILGLGSLVVCFNRYFDQASYYYKGGALLAALFTAALIAGVERAPTGPVARLLSIAPVAWLGRISYGVYLWHWPILLWLHLPDDATGAEKRVLTVARIALTLAVSAASFYLLERPIRSGKVPWIRRNSARTVLAFVVALGLLSTAAYASTRPQTKGSIAVQATQGSVVACPKDPEPCLRVKGPAGAPVITTIGDSTMQAYDPGLRQLAKTHGFTYVQGAAGGCPIGHRFIATGLNGQLHKRANYVCFRKSPGIFRDLIGPKWKTDVFIGTAYNEQSRSMAADGKTVLVPGTKAHIDSVEAELEKSVELLTSKGAYLALVHMLPRGPAVTCLDDSPPTAPRCNYPVADDKLAATYNKVMDRVAARHTAKVKIVDVTDLVCPDGVCGVIEHGIVMRYDGGHYTKKASEWIAPYLYQRLREAGIPLP